MIHRKPKLDFQQVLKLIFICLVAQSCLTLCALMDCSSPGKNTGVGCHALLQGIFLTQGSNPHLLHWQVDSLPLSHLESPKLLFPIFNLDLRSSQAKSEKTIQQGRGKGPLQPSNHSFIYSFPCFLHDSMNAGTLISDFSAFSKPSLYIRKFLVHILLKPSLKDFGVTLLFTFSYSRQSPQISTCQPPPVLSAFLWYRQLIPARG